MLPIKRRKVDDDRPKSLDAKKKKVKYIEKPASSDSSSPEPQPETVQPEKEDPEAAAEGQAEAEAPKSFKDLVCNNNLSV